MKKFLFLILAFIVFASTDFAQKPSATPVKKTAAPPAKKESATADKKAKPSVKKETSKKETVAPTTKKSVASPTKKETASSAKKEVKKETAAPTKKSASPATTVTEISTTDWKNLTDALQAQQWSKADALATDYLKKSTVENGDRQFAQLRYFRLYALAGEIVAFQGKKAAAEENAAWTLLDKTISEFNGKELIFPPHAFLADCRGSVNFVCPVKDDERALRVTATNKEGTAIHSFNYVSFDDKIVFDNFDGGKIFLGGKLRRAEFNQDSSKPWVMRLFFDSGFITRADVN